MSDLEAGADKGALGLQEVDTSENQELNITVTEPEDQPPMQASGDQTKPIASALAEAFSSTLSPLLNEIIQQNKQLLEEKKKSELFLSAASPSNLEPKKSIKGAGKTILGDPGAKKHHFDDSLIELKGPHQEEIQKQKEFISKTMDVVKDFEEKGAKPKIYGIPPYKTEDNKWKSNIQQLAHLFMITLLLLILSHSHWYPPFKII